MFITSKNAALAVAFTGLLLTGATGAAWAKDSGKSGHDSVSVDKGSHDKGNDGSGDR